jgi:hypothetical protein
LLIDRKHVSGSKKHEALDRDFVAALLALHSLVSGEPMALRAFPAPARPKLSVQGARIDHLRFLGLADWASERAHAADFFRPPRAG